MNPVVYVALAIAIGMILVLSAMLLKAKQALSSINAAEQTAQKIIGDSKKEAENTKKEALLEAKDKILNLRAEVEKQTRDRKSELLGIEKRLNQKEELLEKKDSSSTQRERDLAQKEKKLAERERSLSLDEKRVREVLVEQKRQLEVNSGMSAEEAKKHLLKQLETEAKREAVSMIKKIEEESRATAQ